jgi:hypothetical protein
METKEVVNKLIEAYKHYEALLHTLDEIENPSEEVAGVLEDLITVDAGSVLARAIAEGAIDLGGVGGPNQDYN